MNRVPFFYREFGTLVNAENADFFSLISVNQRCLRPDTLTRTHVFLLQGTTLPRKASNSVLNCSGRCSGAK